MKNYLYCILLFAFALVMSACSGESGEAHQFEPIEAEAEVEAEEVIDEDPNEEAITEGVNEEEDPIEEDPIEEDAEIKEVEGELSVHFIDVGQGDSILLDGPDFSILIDAGQHNRDDVVPYLNDAGIEHLDLAVGTHPHADHIGQLDNVINNIAVDEVWMNGDEHTSQTFERVLDAILESDADYEEPSAGDSATFGSANIKVVNPSSLSGDTNDNSLVLRVDYGETSFLFAGDAESSAEQAMLSSGHNLDVDILKVGHHGSNTSSTQSFLEAINPEVAVYMAGEDNQYGHPHDEVIERLESVGSEIYGTAQHGHIIITTDGESYDIETVTSVSSSSNTEPTQVEEEVIKEEPVEEETVEEPLASCEAGTVAVNTASFEELQQIIEIGPDRAEQILNLRPFNSYSDFKRINGIAEVRAAQIEEQGIVCFN